MPNGQALNANTFSFTAPGTAQVLSFNVTVTDANNRASVLPVKVTVTSSSDSLTIPVAPTYKLKDASWTLTVNGTNNTAKVTVHVINQAGIEVLTLIPTQTPGQAVWSFNTRSQLISPAPTSLAVRVTSDKGGSIGPVAVTLK